MILPAWGQIGQRNKSLCGQLKGLSAGHDCINRFRCEECKLQYAGDVALILAISPRERAHRGKALRGQVLPPLVGVGDHLNEGGIGVCCPTAIARSINYELRFYPAAEPHWNGDRERFRCLGVRIRPDVMVGNFQMHVLYRTKG